MLTASELVVIYPEVREPFAQVFEDIVKGARDGYKQRAQLVALSENQSPVAFVSVLDRQSPVLVLGNRLAREVSTYNPDHKVIVGAVNVEFDNVFGITLSPSFEIVSSKLRLLVPGVKNIHVIVGPNEGGPLTSAVDLFLQQNLKLIVHPAEDIRAAAAVYRALIQKLDEKDAVWILPSGSFIGNAMLSILLQASWDKHFVVFSSNPVHVKRGALFSLYPNNYKMGLSLGRLARDIAADKAPDRKMQPLDDVFVTINERASKHLGVHLTDDVLRQVDLVLPAR
jgi:putative tryptophan/tyrosine transport system substrate-binding protein